MTIVNGDSSVWAGIAGRLGLGGHEHVSIVGGGGKTSLMFALASQLAGRRVITTTTKMGGDQNYGRPILVDPTADDVVDATDGDGQVVVWKQAVVDSQRGAGYSKAIGVDPRQCDEWFERVDHVLVEADGARRKPFKAPRQGEPVVPSTSTMLIIVAGADALGRVIIDQCHRPLRVAALAGCQPGDRLTPTRAARVVTHQRGFMDHVPAHARVRLVVTKVDDSNEPLVAQFFEAMETMSGGGVHPLSVALEPIRVFAPEG